MKIRRAPGWRAAWTAAGLVALAVYLVFTVPSSLFAMWGRLREVPVASHDDAHAALMRFRGPGYAAAIDRIKGALPEDSAYLLLDSGDHTIVRFDLAPRRAVFGGGLKEAAANADRSLPKWTVIPGPDPPGPRLVETSRLREEVRP